MSDPRCPQCQDNGIVIDYDAGTWDVCRCSRGEEISGELRQGVEDMKDGRTVRWPDIRVND